MASLSDPQGKIRELFDKMTLGVVRYLEKKPGVTDVRMLERQPAEKQTITTWEQKNMCFLPEDMKNFYQTTDGLLIQWCIKFDGSVLPLGRMEINPVTELLSLTKSQTTRSDDTPSLADVVIDTDYQDDQGRVKPHFDSRSKVFELDPCSGFGKVCLVYNDLKAGVTTSKPEIWLLDRSLEWYFVASSFTSYFRMMIVHLGLPLWQYIFTSTGISPETKQWFNMYAPVRLALDESFPDSTNDRLTPSPTNFPISSIPTNKLDIDKIFKGKCDKSKHKTSQNKKTNSSKIQTRQTGSRNIPLR